MKRILGILLLCAVVSLIGCANRSNTYQIVCPDFEGIAVEVGNKEPIGKRFILNADCVVKYYITESEMYISEQNHTINPHDFGLSIIANEPGNTYVWEIANDCYLGPKVPISQSLELCSEDVANAILLSYLAGSTFVDFSELETGDDFKFNSLWYRPADIATSTNEDLISTVWQRLDTGKYDTVAIMNTLTGDVLLGRTYNFRYLSTDGTKIPMNIDISLVKCDQEFNDERLIMQIKYQFPTVE